MRDPAGRRFGLMMIAAGLLLAVALGVGLTPVFAATAHRHSLRWTAIKAPLPANAEANPLADLFSETCPAAGSCVAAGTYTDTDGDGQGLVETLSDGTWTPTAVPLPTNQASTPLTYYPGVLTCGAPGSCVVLGNYYGTDGTDQGVIETLSTGAWAATAIPVPADASATSGALYAVACQAADSCVALGDYTDASGNEQALLETLSAGAWTPMQAPLSTNAAANPEVSPDAERCPMAGTCVAWGNYTDSNGDCRLPPPKRPLSAPTRPVTRIRPSLSVDYR